MTDTNSKTLEPIKNNIIGSWKWWPEVSFGQVVRDCICGVSAGIFVGSTIASWLAAYSADTVILIAGLVGAILNISLSIITDESDANESE